jgi:hypothetical protein
MTIELGTTDVTRIYVGTTQVNRVYVGSNIVFGAVSGLGSGSVLSSNFDDNVILYDVDTAQATASIEFQTDGTVVGGNISQLNWFSTITAGIGSSYWLLVNTPSSGTFTTGTVGSRQQLNAVRGYTATTTGISQVRSKSVTATYEIWDASTGGTQVGSGTITLSAEVDNS